jgi:hypothetical protein
MTQPKDPDHWLYRLTPHEWLQAASHEVLAATRAIEEREQRRGVAYARRAAGMALNAVLVLQPNEAWGRSYMDHLKALAGAGTAPAPVREAARELVEAPLDGPKLVRLGGASGDGISAATKTVIEWCEEEVAALLRA